VVNSVWIAPASAAALERFKISSRPAGILRGAARVFYEDFKNLVLYVQDVAAAAARLVKGFFLRESPIPRT